MFCGHRVLSIETKKCRIADVDAIDQLADVILASTTMKKAEQFCWDSWDDFLKEHCAFVRNINFYQRFSFSADNSGICKNVPFLSPTRQVN